MSLGRSIPALCLTLGLVAFGSLSGPVGRAYAQGVTTGGIGGVVINAQKQPVAGASVIAIHEPSGTSYDATTRTWARRFRPCSIACRTAMSSFTHTVIS